MGHEPAHPLDVERLERVAREQALLDVRRQELARIVARKTHRRLREVVGAERKKLCPPGELVG